MSVTRKGFRRCTKCERNRAERFFKAKGRVCFTCQRKRGRVASRDVRIVETHNITTAEYEEILEAQDGVCAICKGARSYRLDVDHDHAIERELIAQGLAAPLAHRASIRGALCKTCNRRLLPAAHDDVFLLARAINYLHNPPAFDVIGAVKPTPDDRVVS